MAEVSLRMFVKIARWAWGGTFTMNRPASSGAHIIMCVQASPDPSSVGPRSPGSEA